MTHAISNSGSPGSSWRSKRSSETTPDVADRVLSALDRPAPPTRRRSSTAAILFLGIAATGLVMFWPGAEGPEPTQPASRPAPSWQDPSPEPFTDLHPNSHAALRQLLKDLTAVRLTWQHRSKRAALIGTTRLVTPGWVPVPELQTTVELDAIPLGAPVRGSHAPRSPVVCEFLLTDNRRIRGHLATGDQAFFGAPTLPMPLHLDLDPLAQAIESLGARARREFAAVDSAQELAEVPAETRHIVCAGIDDDGLAKLERLTELRTLTISTHLDAIAQIPMLGNLPIFGNQFRREEPATQISDRGLTGLSACRNLRTVILVGIAVSDDTLELLARLPALRSIHIREGSRSTLTGKGFAPLATEGRGLRTLELEGCPEIDDAGLITISEIATDELKIAFAGNDISRQGLGAFLGKLKTRALVLDGTEFDRRVLQLTAEAPLRGHLETLCLRHGTVDLEGIEGFLELRELRLEECRVPSGALEPLAGARIHTLVVDRCSRLDVQELEHAILLPCLRSVGLRNLREGIDWAHLLPQLAGAKQLKTLDLTGCQAEGDQLVPALRGFSHLEILDLRGNSIAPAQQTSLQQALPETAVHAPTTQNRIGRRR